MIEGVKCAENIGELAHAARRMSIQKAVEGYRTPPRCRVASGSKNSARFWGAAALCHFGTAFAVATVMLTGCQTTGERLSPINFSQPGWTIRQGQALWKVKRAGPELAGEVVLAHNDQNRSWIQFTKTPLPLVTARLEGQRWQCEFHPQERTVSGQGKAPTQLAWVHFLSAVNGGKPPAPFKFSKSPDGALALENSRSGEMLTIFLNP